MRTSVRKFWFVSAVLLLPVSVAAAQSGKVCAVQQYGAKGDGTTLDTAAIQKAIDDCAASGGGVVRLAGVAKFVSAPVVLKSHVTLEIAAGTTLEGSTNHDDYPEIEQFHSKGRQSLLSAKDAEDITIRGGGVIDGRGDSWWANPRQIRPRLIVFDHCKHVLMENVTVENSPMWQIVPYYSDDLTFRNMKILAPEPAGHNTDGIDPFSSGHILIDHVTIDTGDDNVAIKSGQPGSAGPDAPSHDITVRDCTFLHGHGMSVGSEVAGGVQHVLVERVHFNGTTQGIRLKSGRDRGGDLSDFTYKDITMEDVKTAIQITDYYGGDQGGCVDGDGCSGNEADAALRRHSHREPESDRSEDGAGHRGLAGGADQKSGDGQRADSGGDRGQDLLRRCDEPRAEGRGAGWEAACGRQWSDGKSEVATGRCRDARS